MKKCLSGLVLFISSIFLVGCFTYSEGERVGTVIKLSRKGLICKTWEAEMVRGGLVDGSGAFSAQTFHFTIESEPFLASIREAMGKQAEVKVRYREELVTLCRSDSQDYFLTSIELLARQASSSKNGIPPEFLSKIRGWLTSEEEINSLWEQRDPVLGGKSPQELWSSNRTQVLSFIEIKKSLSRSTAK